MAGIEVPDPQLALSEAPRSQVDGRVFQRPQKVGIGPGLEQLSAGLEDLAVPLARIQGQEDASKAVTRSPDGSIAIIDHPATPILGRAGEAYRAANESALLAAGRSATDLQMAQLATQHANDPDGFAAAATGYISHWKDSQPGPLGLGMAQYAQSVAAQHGVNLIGQKQRTDLAENESVADGRVKQLEDQMDGLAAQGGMQSPAFAAADKERAAILAAKVANPAYAFSQPMLDLANANLSNRLHAAMFTGEAREAALKTGNISAAVQELDGKLRQLPISEKELLAYEGEATRHLTAMSAVSAQQRQQLSDQADTLRVTATQHPDAVSPQQFDDMSLQLERSKLFQKSADLQASKLHALIIAPAIVSGTVQDAVNGLHQVQALAANAAPGGYMTALRQQENNTGDPTAGNGGGTYQFTPGTWAALSARHPELNLTPGGRTDPGQEQRAIAVFTNENRAALHAAGIQPTDANTYMAHFLGASGATSFIKAMQANPAAPAAAINLAAATANPTIFYKNGDTTQPRSLQEVYALQTRRFGGGTTPGLSQDAGPVAMRFSVALKDAQDSFNKRATALNEGVTQAIQANFTPTPLELEQLRTMAPDISDPVLRQKITDNLTKAQTLDSFAKLPVGQQQDFAATMKAMGQQGQLPQLPRQMIEPIERQVRQITKMATDDPVSLGVLKTPPRVAQQAQLPALQPLDPSDPNGFATGLKARQLWKGIAKADPAVGDMPLRVTDVQQMAAQAPGWTGQQAQVALQTMGAVLTGPEQEALMADKGFKDTVTGMARSGDYAKMNAAYSFLDLQKRRNPILFAAQNEGIDKDLSTWQSLVGFMPPDEVTKRMTSYYDPAQVKAREALGGVAKEALKTVDADSVVSRLFGSWMPYMSPGQIASPGAGTSDGGIGGARLAQDYRKAYTDHFEDTGSKDAAQAYAERVVGEKYSVSAFNDGRVMARAPDREQSQDGATTGVYYPKINGSFDWLKDQLRMDVQQTPFFSNLRHTNPKEAADLARGNGVVLWPDDKTEADIASGRKPSYVVMAKTGGRFAVIESQPGTAMRFRGDPTLPSQKAEADRVAHMVNARAVDATGYDMPLGGQ